jgi:hypothetical protein
MTLFSKTVAERTKPGQRQDVEEQGTMDPNESEERRSRDLMPFQIIHSTLMAEQKEYAVS